jgi:hypothetical protein
LGGRATEDSSGGQCIMVAFDADKSVDNSKLPELKIFEKKTENWAKKGILYFERDGVVIEMAALVKNNKGKEKGKITGLVAKTDDGEPIWDMGGLKYDFNKFFKKIDNGKLDEVIQDIFKKKDTIWGSHLDDELYGFDGNDTLKGWRGDDILNGGKGKDMLIGNQGADTFVFDQKLGTSNMDTIYKFKVGEDMIQLSPKIFVGLDKGTLKEANFKIGKNASGDEPQVIYKAKKGLLLFDADGAGGASAQKFAKMQKNKDLSHDDFIVG